jgi:acylphosphatase
MRVARRYLIRGRVQGVGFRFFTQAAAAREGLHGWVRNNPDRCVEVAAEGEADALERFERHLRHGPPGARIDDVEVADMTTAGAISQDLGFTIR